jgi:hypothetical protein
VGSMSPSRAPCNWQTMGTGRSSGASVPPSMGLRGD